MKQPRIYALDGARGLAAFGILLYHVAGSSFAAFSNLYIAVDFFFVLSGFVLAPAISKVLTINDAMKFLVKRYIRIIPMVLAVLTFTTAYDLIIIIKHWIFGEPASDAIILSIPTLLVSILMLQIFYTPAVLVDYPVWSLSAEWVVNVFVTLSRALTQKYKYISLILGIFSIIISEHSNSEMANQLGRALLGFSFGLIVYEFQKQYYVYRNWIKLISLLIVPTYVLASKLGFYESLCAIWPLGAWILILSKLKFRASISKYLGMVGKYSYGFYIWHFPMLSLTSLALNHINIELNSVPGLFMQVLIASSLSIFATKVSLKIFEEPFRQFWTGKLQLV